MANTVQLKKSGVPVFPITDASVVIGLPEISTDISADGASDAKVASPKAVKTYVDSYMGDIETLLAAI